MRPRLLLIINPKAGHAKGPLIKDLIAPSGISDKYDVEVAFTQARGHAIDLAKKAVADGVQIVVAAGGDGTVNEVASALVNSPSALAIIPAGSGNGLAKHLNYPMNPIKSLKKIKDGKINMIDTLQINDRFALNVSGLGFDGYVAWLFNQNGKRGLMSYTKIALKEYFTYESADFNLLMDDQQITMTAHMVVIANASQFGNAAIIAPFADLRDGLIDIVVVKRPPWFLMPGTFYHLFNGSLKPNQYTRMLTCKKLSIRSSRPLHLHIDGEPNEPVSNVEVKVQPQSLKVIV